MPLICRSYFVFYDNAANVQYVLHFKKGILEICVHSLLKLLKKA